MKKLSSFLLTILLSVVSADSYAATFTAFPSGAGTNSAWVNGAGTVPTSVQTNDGLTSYRDSGTSGNLDTYAMDDHTTQVGTISSVVVHDVVKIIGSSATYQICLRTQSTNFCSGNLGATSSFVDVSNTWTTNPSTTVAWTWSDIDALEAGIKQAGSAPDVTGNTQTYFVVTYTPSSIYNQEHFQWYNDDGTTVNNQTALGGVAQDISYYNSALGDVKSIRLETANTGTLTGNIVRELWYSKNGGSYAVVPTSAADITMNASSVWSNGDATTTRLTAVGSFQAGQGRSTSNDTSSLALVNGSYTEDQWSIKIAAGATGSYCFEVYNNQTGSAVPIDTYTNIPCIAPVQYLVSGQPLLWTSTQWTNPTVKFQAAFYTSNASYPAHMKLYDVTAAADVASSDISNTSTSSSANNETLSSALTLTDGHYYVPYKGIAHGATVTPQQRMVNTKQ